MNLLVFTLLLTVAQNVVKLIGEDLIIQFVWSLYIQVSSNPSIHNLSNLKKEQLKIYKQQHAISAQDEYAKWTKLNRKLDQLKKDIDSATTEISAQRAGFNKTIKSTLYVLLKVPIFAVSIWYRSSPIFYLPKNALPGYIVWFLRFPSAPPNSVGITVWCFCINTVVDTVTTIIKQLQTPSPAATPVVPVEQTESKKAK